MTGKLHDHKHYKVELKCHNVRKLHLNAVLLNRNPLSDPQCTDGTISDSSEHVSRSQKLLDIGFVSMLQETIMSYCQPINAETVVSKRRSQDLMALTTMRQGEMSPLQHQNQSFEPTWYAPLLMPQSKARGSWATVPTSCMICKS